MATLMTSKDDRATDKPQEKFCPDQNAEFLAQKLQRLACDLASSKHLKIISNLKAKLALCAYLEENELQDQNQVPSSCQEGKLEEPSLVFSDMKHTATHGEDCLQNYDQPESKSCKSTGSRPPSERR